MAVVQCEFVQLWKSQALRLRLLYSSWKPKQSGNPFISCHVWFLPFLMSLWLTALISIILLAVYVQKTMDVDAVVWNMGLLMCLNLPVMVTLGCFAWSQYTEHARCCHYHHHYRQCQSTNCSFCIHHGLRENVFMTTSIKIMALFVQILKCARIFTLLFLILLSGDVETNPGPDNYMEYVSSLPENIRSYLDKTLDWDHKEEFDLNHIAEKMLDWEEKLSAPLGLTYPNIVDLKREPNPVLLRRNVLRKWKESKGRHGTFGKLLEVCCEAKVSSVAEAICEVLIGKQSSEESTEDLIHEHEEVSDDVQVTPATCTSDCADTETYREFPFLPSCGEPRKDLSGRLKVQTRDIKSHYSSFSFSLMTSVIERIERGEVKFSELSLVVKDFFHDLTDADPLLSGCCTKDLFGEIRGRQSYVNFNVLQAVARECGTEEDKKGMEIYEEAFFDYAKKRTFQCDPELLGQEITGYKIVMFVLDKDHEYKLMDAYEFKAIISKWLNCEVHLLKGGLGSIVIFIQVPPKCIHALEVAPLYHHRVLRLKSWGIQFYGLDGFPEIINLNNLRVVEASEVQFNDDDSIMTIGKTKIISALWEKMECMAFEYMASLPDESEADTGYVSYLQSLVSGKLKNLPAIKGVLYRYSNKYPVIIFEKMKRLQDILSEKVSHVNQVSVLADLVECISSFQNYEVKIFMDSIFVRDDILEIEAKFCPLYGYSFTAVNLDSHDGPIPCNELKWMDELVKSLEFQGSVSYGTELPHDHILKKLFTQKWLAKDDRFRPGDYKELLSELQHVLEVERSWHELKNCSSDHPVKEVQIHLILIGLTGVGKTSVRRHLKNEPMDENESPTIVMEPEYLYRESVEVGPFKHIKDSLTAGPNKVFLSLWDTGGQPIFQDLLPCFARLQSMYGIVFRLSDIETFDSKPEIRQCTRYDEVAISPFTNEDMIYRNLAYVAAYPSIKKYGNAEGDSNFPAAIILGTFQDKVSPASLQLKKRELEKKIGEFIKNQQLFQCPTSDYSQGNIIEIDNTVSGKKQDRGIECLRNAISLSAEKCSITVNLAWLQYKAKLQRLCYTLYVNLGIIPLTEALRIGKEECGVSNPRAALIYFHDLGIFMWFHMSVREKLKNYIVIEPKTLIDVLSRLFCLDVRRFQSNEECLSRGMVTLTYFESLLRRKASSIDDSWFIAFLEENYLSVKITFSDKEPCYFLPSLLSVSNDYEKNLDQASPAPVAPLYILPHSGYIATGMFPRLLTALAGVNSQRGSTSWRIPLPSCSWLKGVCRNQFEFVVNECVHVILSEFAKYIRVDCVPCGDVTNEADYFLEGIVSTLDVQLQRIVPRWINERRYNFTFECNNIECSPTKHFFISDIPISERVHFECSQKRRSTVTSSQLLWCSSRSNHSESLKVFEESLKEGSFNIRIVSMMFVGVERPGSSSVKRMVFQEIQPTSSKPTLLSEHNIYFRAKGDHTLEGVKIHNHEEIISYAISKDCEEKSINLSESKTVPETLPISSGTNKAEVVHGVLSTASFENPLEEVAKGPKIEDFPVINSYEDDSDLTSSLIDYANVQSLVDCMTQHKKKGEIEFYHVFDCGSCLIHIREILKIFIRNVSLCVLVTDLSRNLTDIELDVLSDVTATKGLVIGTHDDLKLPTTKMARNSSLYRYSNFLIETNQPNDFIFPVNCKEYGLTEIGANVVHHGLRSADSKFFPFNWYVFCFKLQGFMSKHGLSTLSISEECMIIARKLNMNKSMVITALEHLTQYNMILYFRNGLEDIVFSDVSMFSKILSTLYMNSRQSDRGTFTQSEFDIAVKYYISRHLNHDDLIRLFSNLLIIAPLGDADLKYFAPSFLPLLDEAERRKVCASSTNPNLQPILFECPSTGYEFITMLFVFLLTQGAQKWHIIDGQSLYKNCAKFQLKQLPYSCIVTLSSYKGAIEVYVRSAKISDSNLTEIRNVIVQGLEKTRIILSGHDHHDFKMTFRCKCGKFDDEHASSYKYENGFLICSKDKSNAIHPTSSHQKWLKDPHEFGTSLTVSNVCKKLHDFSDQWMKVAKILKVDSLVANSILVSRLNDASSLNRVVEWWFMNTSTPEWNDVVEVLRVLDFSRDIHTDELESQFGDIADRTFDIIRERGIGPNNIKQCLLNLPIKYRKQHKEFLEHWPRNTSVTVEEIWLKLAMYWNFLNYTLLEHLVNKFGDYPLKTSMLEYKKTLQEFRYKTSLCDFARDFKGLFQSMGGEELMAVKLGRNWKECTLEDLENCEEIVELPHTNTAKTAPGCSYYSVWVGGLKGVVQEKDLTSKFSQYGNILHVMVTRDPETKTSRHCGFVVFRDEQTAEAAARGANGSVIHGGTIIARGPAEQRRRGYSGEYKGKTGYVPSIANDKRPYTDCIHYVTSVCTNGFSCPYRHSAVARNSHAPVCPVWSSNTGCTDVCCPRRHPGPKQLQSEASATNDIPVLPLFAQMSLHDQNEGTIQLASHAQFRSIGDKFRQDWAKGVTGEVKAVYIIDNPHLKRTWTRYKQSLPYVYQQTEDHYHGTKLLCNLTANNDLCCDRDCSVCRIAESGFDEQRIKTSIPRFQRFGRGMYLAPQSSKCHDYTQGAYTYRALLLCEVCPGNKYHLLKGDQSLLGPPESYHSIYGLVGGSLNYEEIVLPRADAILPKYIIVYRKNGVDRIAK